MQNNNHRYILDPAKGTATKTSCPHCGKKKCFKRYIDRETGEYLSHDCGRCDHEQSCGYHYTPKQWLKEHEWQTVGQPLRPARQTSQKAISAAPAYVTFPMWMVEARHADDSTFMVWLQHTISDTECLRAVYDAYWVGKTMTADYKTPAVIFWYIDANGIVHDGKLMWYKEDGHREQMVNWISSRMRKAGKIADNAETEKCFFGEHLLNTRPEAPVAIVESEKTALFCACFYPKYIWLATGGCSGLNASKMQILAGRRVVFFPDSGKLDEWRAKVASVKGCNISFFEDLEQYPPNTDIVDALLQQLSEPPVEEKPATVTQPQPEVPVQTDPMEEDRRIWLQMKACNPSLQLLEDYLDLELAPREGPCPF